MTDSSQKWPSQFKMVKLLESPIGGELTFFFVTGIVNRRQRDYVAGEITLLAEQKVDADKLAISALLNQQQFEDFNSKFERLAREHRGQFQAAAKAIVAAHRELMEGS